MTRSYSGKRPSMSLDVNRIPSSFIRTWLAPEDDIHRALAAKQSLQLENAFARHDYLLLVQFCAFYLGLAKRPGDAHPSRPYVREAPPFRAASRSGSSGRPAGPSKNAFSR